MGEWETGIGGASRAREIAAPGGGNFRPADGWRGVQLRAASLWTGLIRVPMPATSISIRSPS